ncbi:unnamed protein product [Spirodela intermedia]|uniref:Uncharacterized protein n=1 Tax=Spirodela intermedia TaxID=51605 RepID=A0A7I8JIL4_SPIIN|nr:unnamed protein product [Spirodela intermedia]CAA6669262.1 unnamed protein product [Spirodela intermedia]
MEFCVFSGMEPEGWIFRLELYFSTYQLTMLEKLAEALEEYHEQLEFLSGVIRNILEVILKGTFLKGLRRNIQAEVYMLNPHKLEAIMQTT